ncbi:MAG TPA: SH3 domain-containing protein, partial [Caldilineaceae bacterium]|nr:SH3 domain-containing protein [Caldilineaceae bacterium]
MRHFISALLLITALLVGLLPATPTYAAPAPPFAVVTIPRLNVRAAPSTNAPVVGQVTGEERVTVLGRNGEGTWLRVEGASGVSGWVFAEMTQPSVPITALDVYGGSIDTSTPASQGRAEASTSRVGENQLASYPAAQPQTAPAVAPSVTDLAPAANGDPQPIGPTHPGPALSAPAATANVSNVAMQPLCAPNRLRTVSLGGQPQTYAALDDRIYVALSNVSSLLVVDAGMDMMLGTSRTTADRIGHIAAGNEYLYVTDAEKQKLYVTSRYGAVQSEIKLAGVPGPVAVTDGRAFVLHPQIGAVSVVDLGSKETIATLNIGADPRQIVVISGRAYIGHGAGFLSVVDGFGRRQEQLHLPVNDVVGMTANPKNGMLYVASGLDQKIVAVDVATWTLATTWTLDTMPSSLAYNDITDHLFVLDSTSQLLTILSGTDPGRVSQVQVSKQPARDSGNSLVLLQSKLYVMHPSSDNLGVWLDRTCPNEMENRMNILASTHSRTDLAPRRVEARIGILWPQGGLKPEEAALANITAALLREDGASPACSWEPEVTLWAAVGADPAQRVAVGERRLQRENGVAFPVYDFNDIDVRMTRDRKLPMHFSVRVDGVETAQNVWTHAASGQFRPTVRPELDGLVNRYTGPLDARLWVEETADGPQVYGLLLQAGSLLGMAPSSSATPPQLRWALDNGVTEPELVVGRAETRQEEGFVYTVWRFPGLDPNGLLRA